MQSKQHAIKNAINIIQPAVYQRNRHDYAHIIQVRAVKLMTWSSYMYSINQATYCDR